jgi:outer membrane lipoprotein-sorting protein
MMKKFFVIMIAVVLSGMWTWAQAQTVDKIVQKYAKTMGGAEKIKAIKTMKVEGKFIRQSMEAAVTIWAKRPDLIKLEIVFGGQTMVIAYDGKTAWTINPFTGSTEPKEAPKEETEDLAGTADMVNDPLIDYKKKGHKLELIGKEDMEGTEVFKLQLTRKNNKVSTFYLDAETFILLKTSTTRERSGQQITSDMVFGDYKPVAGVMMPHAMETYVNNQAVGSITFNSFEPNIKLEDGFFKMPEVEKKEVEKKEEEKK